MNICVVIPVHGGEKRLELAKRVILYYETLEINGLNIKACPVLDDTGEVNFPDSDMAVQFCGDNPYDPSVFSPPGSTIGRKFNDGVHAIINRSIRGIWDGVMIVGSDDLIAPSVFQQILCDQPLYQELTGLHFYNNDTGEMVWDPNFLCGCGKYFSAEFLDRCDWRPYEDDKNKNVDKGPNRFLKPGERRALRAAEHDPVAISIEVADNMTDWDTKTMNAYPVTDKKKAFVAMDGEWEDRWKV